MIDRDGYVYEIGYFLGIERSWQFFKTERGRYRTPDSYEYMPNSEKVITNIPITHHELARMAGTRWETSIRILSDMRKRRWIDSGRGHITILQPQAIQQCANGFGKARKRTL